MLIMHIKDVLLVDDEPVFLSALAEGLKSLTGKRCNVITARNGKEAIDILRTVMVDVVVTDLEMPVMSGLELAEHLKMNHPDVAVVVASAFIDANSELALRSLQVDHFADKPLDLRELTHTIMSVRNLPPMDVRPLGNELRG
jgi:YesN/AraC family two-component response regulator